MKSAPAASVAPSSYGDEPRLSEAAPSMPLLAHFGELRRRLVRCLVVLIVAFFACYPFAETIFNRLAEPLRHAAIPGKVTPQLIYTAPFEVFVVFMKLALVAALILSLPYLFAQVWGFIAPGLRPQERRLALPFVTLATLFFVGGVLFAYYVALPTGYAFFIGYAPDYIAPNIRVSEYMSATTQMLLVFGAVFETPLLLSALIYLRLLSVAQIVKQWRAVIVGVAIVAAVLSPADVMSMILLGVPLLGLFGVSLVLGLAIEKLRRPRPGPLDSAADKL